MLANLDIIGSIVVAGVLMLAIFRLDAQVADRCLASSLTLIAQTNGASLAEVIETDLRRIGLNVPEGTPDLVAATSDRLEFWGDVDLDGEAESVVYARGGAYGPSPNPDDSLLLRSVGAEPPLAVETGITRFQLTYWDGYGVGTSTLSDIREIEVDFRAEAPEAYRYWNEATASFVEEYSGNDWLLRVRPKNL